MKRIVITGGCGFIGVNLILHLRKQNPDIRIRVLDNLSVGTREDLGQVTDFSDADSNAMDWDESVHLVEGDVQDSGLALRVCEQADAVVHLAGNTGVLPSVEDPRADCEANVLGTLNMLEACRLHGVSRFLFASSGAPLGKQTPPIHEEMAPHPMSPYGASKLACEGYCSAYFHSYDLDTVILRFGNVYGSYSFHKGSVVAKFSRLILNGEALPVYGDGSQTRDFIHVRDLVRAIEAGLLRPDARGKAFQIASNREHTVTEVADLLNAVAEEVLKRRSPVVHEAAKKGEILRNFSDITRARQILQWEPEIGFREGLKETFQWFTRMEKV